MAQTSLPYVKSKDVWSPSGTSRKSPRPWKSLPPPSLLGLSEQWQNLELTVKLQMLCSSRRRPRQLREKGKRLWSSYVARTKACAAAFIRAFRKLLDGCWGRIQTQTWSWLERSRNHSLVGLAERISFWASQGLAKMYQLFQMLKLSLIKFLYFQRIMRMCKSSTTSSSMLQVMKQHLSRLSRKKPL